MTGRKNSIGDDAQLAALGIRPELQRQFSPLAMLGLAFTILNTWAALAGSFSLSLSSGGPVAVVWGFLAGGICNLCLAASLAEFLSAYPTAGGQYHWVAVIAPEKWRPLLSYITGWINTSGWIALIAAGGLLGSQFIFGIIALEHPDFVPQRWQQFLIYSAYNLFSFIVNAFLNSSLNIFNQFTIVWSTVGFIIICIVALSTAAPNFNSASTVFSLFINETGWPDGVAWLLGLLQGGLALTAFDSVAHMVEEIPNAAIEAPRIMVYAVAFGLFTGFVFLVSMLFVAGDLSTVATSPNGPLLQILYTATSSNAGSICLLIFPIVCLLFASTSVQTAATRMTWAFARDRALPASKMWAKVHPKLGLPLNALILTTVIVTVFGLILIGSSSAFNAIVSASVVALGVSYGIPIAINICYGRKALPKDRPFILPGPLGWICNIVGVVYVIVTTILFLFPPVLPVTGSSMNYCIVAFGIVLIIAVVQWFVDGRKNYTGPVVEMEDNVLVAPQTNEDPSAGPAWYDNGKEAEAHGAKV
ncbi:putative choline transport protein [Elsinoe australis]|uniref:Putative choline transport protein n=1 Tax=Elsinoe australis TaxID=40998 RepID=A0A4U7B3F6_9PEZI|nr:putative choline transport protein [Elsinoe australis]